MEKNCGAYSFKLRLEVWTIPVAKLMEADFWVNESKVGTAIYHLQDNLI